MIVGHGDIASVLPDRPDLLFFAAGVSNSQETNEDAYARELNLLAKQDRKEHIVYFSSLSIFYTDTRYTKHKLEMEDIIRRCFRKGTIIRVGNISWGINPNTFINFIKNKIKNHEPFEVKDEYRYIIDKDEFLHWIGLIPNWNCEMNIPGNRMKVSEAINKYISSDILNEISMTDQNGERIWF